MTRIQVQIPSSIPRKAAGRRSTAARLGASILLVLALLLPRTAAAQLQRPLGQFEGHGDVGSVKLPGTVVFDSQAEAYTIAGSGTNMWFDRDEFHFVWKRLRGDFILNARAELLGQGVDPHRKLGWMVRTTLDSNSAHANAAVHGDGLTSLQFRRSTGADTEEVRSPLTGADVIELERKGNTLTMRAARFGDALVSSEVTDLVLGDEVYVGLFVCSHNEDVLERAVFRDVRMTQPAPDDLVPYREYIGSNLEILDVASGARRIVHRSPESLQAPNWTPDGEALIYNHNGRLYRFDLARGTPEEINTGFATRNNNDHVLSFDGRMIGISHHAEEQGGKSLVYTVPVGGGTPRLVTPTGPSYLHGWSPDGRYLLYTAEREGDYDIYRIPAEGGHEVRLTEAKGLDDGSEYTPDGQYIYFNSVRSGTMQIWRMRPDGAGQQQVTDDAFNNWFPHISPDGKWIAFLSFGQDVAPDDHPFYKRVYLRLMPIQGGEPKVVAYVYGGQGTINVPSWAPDSKRIAFVSNTGAP